MSLAFSPDDEVATAARWVGGNGSGVCTPALVLHLNGFNAAVVTTHGEIDVPTFFPVNGPNGTYSNF